ncbi:arsenate reductase [Wenzhouxiangella sp. AB-CW3]|uniref:arsenate reductase n=1 Tax=Wenzhouxiangella sp. AB-CW3 TaxID=2771012 RepID=UPI00168B88BD|nr:arsenate reductase [Wenzhouxiangella sp. AB-CW3]QOC21755.1 arsenate reductase [Wenzhouxiangella sp. AB-CW3]
MNLYGIKTCDTCRKARKWLDAAGVSYRWHDLREEVPNEDTLRHWLDEVGVDNLVNRRSTTWRGLDDPDREQVRTAEGALPLLREHPALIKRPVIDTGQVVLVGFTDQTGTTLLELP